jgi:DNA-binding CsgD family transcriptional regulator
MSTPHLCLLITNIPHREWSALITTLPQVIGRAPNVQIRVPAQHQTVSRNHAKVWCEGQTAWICDLQSTCGTRINGVNIQPGKPGRISEDDRISLGKLELRVVDESASSGTHLTLNQGEPPEITTILAVLTAQTNPEFEVLEPEALTASEQDVLLWFSRGLTTPQQIGKQIKRSAHTIRTQLNSIFRKLQVHSRDELMGWLVQQDRKRTLQHPRDAD